MDTKFCVKCQKVKPVSDFHRHKNRKDGLSAYCAVCNRAYQAERYLNNLDRERARRAQSRAKHRESIRKKQHEYYVANKDRLRDYKRAWYQANKEAVCEQRRGSRLLAKIRRFAKLISE
jgi:hypothetical protein